MEATDSIAKHWARGDTFALIVAALEKAGKSLNALTVEDLAPVDHFHARGFAATVELADRLPAKAGDRLVDIGSGLGGPARYFAQRFGCEVDGIDITPAFVDAANRLTALTGMQERVRFRQGDGQRLPFDDATFDGGYSLHVTMNVADRAAFLREAARVLRPGAFFALTEHALGPVGDPHHPLPWSEDGSGAFLTAPDDTRRLFEDAGFEVVEVKDTGPDYLAAYRTALELAGKGALPPLGTHLLLGESAPQKLRNAARNIEEGRTQPVQFVCRKRG